MNRKRTNKQEKQWPSSVILEKSNKKLFYRRGSMLKWAHNPSSKPGSEPSSTSNSLSLSKTSWKTSTFCLLFRLWTGDHSDCRLLQLSLSPIKRETKKKKKKEYIFTLNPTEKRKNERDTHTTRGICSSIQIPIIFITPNNKCKYVVRKRKVAREKKKTRVGGAWCKNLYIYLFAWNKS